MLLTNLGWAELMGDMAGCSTSNIGDWHTYELVLVCKTRVGTLEFWPLLDVWQVPQILVPPVIQLCNAGPSASLQQKQPKRMSSTAACS